MTNKNAYLVKNDNSMVQAIENAEKGQKFTITLEEWYNKLAFEVQLKDVADFLRVKETLTRLGISSLGKDGGKPKLFQTCHILQKKGKYYLVHFKELLLLDGKEVNLTWSDLQRRAYIIDLLATWELIDYAQEDDDRIFSEVDETGEGIVQNVSLKILPYAEKENWELVAKYSIGSHKHNNKGNVNE